MSENPEKPKTPKSSDSLTSKPGQPVTPAADGTDNIQAGDVPEQTAPPEEQEQEDPPRPPGLKHSGPGIASFIISVTMLLSGIALLVISTTLLSDGSGGITSDTFIDPRDAGMQQTLLRIGTGFLTVLMMLLAAAVLGILGLAQKQRKKWFAILGTVISLIPLVAFIVLYLIGLVLGSLAV
ncbi:hypothetical protein [Paenibacillus sp. y28]|uniref:hypothetical protein n=1 Tax=Paenibacillus sp. y28 TaxID=3129110 RepID=UPI00301A905C